MKLIENLELGRNCFVLSYQHETTENQWEMFHAHQGIEFHYIHQGDGHIILDQNIHRIQSRMLVYYQPYQLHKINMDTCPDSPYVRTTFVFDPVIADPYLKPFPSLRAFFQYLWKKRLSMQFIDLHENDKVLELFTEFRDRLETAGAYEQQEEMVIFLISLLRYLRGIIGPKLDTASSKKRETRHSEMIMEWVSAHYRQEFALEWLASELHLSPYHISHLFREEMGCSITEYIMVKRLREACLLLSTTSLSIKEISREVGLNSDSYFCQLFRKHMGVSPAKYRTASKKAYAYK